MHIYTVVAIYVTTINLLYAYMPKESFVLT